MTDTMQRVEPTWAPATTETAAWMRLARAAAVTMVAWAVLLQVSARLLIPPVMVVGLVFLAFAPFLRGERRRLGLAFAGVTAVMLVGNLPMIVDELAHPDSAPAFVLSLLSTVAPAVGIVAGLGAFFRWSTQPIRAMAVGAVVVFVSGAVVSIAVAASTESDVALSGDTVVVAEKVEFGPDTMTVASGAAGVLVENKDGIRHTFTIEELDVDLDVPALKSRRADFDAAPGTYTFVCTVPGHENMIGTLVVEG